MSRLQRKVTYRYDLFPLTERCCEHREADAAMAKLVTKEVEKFVNEYVSFEGHHFSYGFTTAGGARFPNALATHLNEYLRPHKPISSRCIKVTGSATPMHEILAWALADPGDGIVTSRPVYGRFEIDFGSRADINVVYAETSAEGCFDEEVVGQFQQALARSRLKGVRVRALLIVNPHNPLGKCYPRSTLIALMKFCQEQQIHLISDEIYACSTFDSGEAGAVPFTSALAIDSTHLIDAELLHVTYGFSKDFGMAGLRIGAIVTRNEALKGAITGVMRFHNPAGPSLVIGAAMLEDRPWCREFLAKSQKALATAYRHATRSLRAIGVSYLPGSNAGFFVWVDLSPWLPADLDGESNAEFALAKKLVDAGVFLHPREEHALEPGWFRLVYTQDAAIVTEGIHRMHQAISSLRCNGNGSWRGGGMGAP